MNIHEFSKLCGVSNACVSNAFCHPEKVAAATRRRIMDFARQYDFRPNRAAAASFNGRTRMIGVMMMQSQISYFSDIFSGIEHQLLLRDYVPFYLTMHWQDSLVVLRQMIDFRVAGVIMVDPRRGLLPDEVREFERIHIPHMLIDGTPHAGYPHDWLSTDDVLGGRLAAQHLLELGHRDLAVVAVPDCPARVSGFAECAAEAGARVRWFYGDEELLTAWPLQNVSAVFCSSDDLAARLMVRLRGLGVRIPDDLSIVGYSDLEFSQWLNPPLTTVGQSGFPLGCRAAEMMLERLAGREAPPRHELMPVHMVIRESTTTFKKTGDDR